MNFTLYWLFDLCCSYVCTRLLLLIRCYWRLIVKSAFYSSFLSHFDTFTHLCRTCHSVLWHVMSCYVIVRPDMLSDVILYIIWYYLILYYLMSYYVILCLDMLYRAFKTFYLLFTKLATLCCRSRIKDRRYPSDAAVCRRQWWPNSRACSSCHRSMQVSAINWNQWSEVLWWFKHAMREKRDWKQQCH